MRKATLVSLAIMLASCAQPVTSTPDTEVSLSGVDIAVSPSLAIANTQSVRTAAMGIGNDIATLEVDGARFNVFAGELVVHATNPAALHNFLDDVGGEIISTNIIPRPRNADGSLGVFERQPSNERWHLVSVSSPEQPIRLLDTQLAGLTENRPQRIRASSADALGLYATVLKAEHTGVHVEFNHALEASSSQNWREHFTTGVGYKPTNQIWWLQGQQQNTQGQTVYGNNVVRVWDELGLTGRGVKVAILDVGFLPRDAEMTAYNPVTRTYPVNGSRFVHQYNFDALNQGYDAEADEAGDYNTGLTYHGHAVSALAVGAANNQYGSAGVAPDATPIVFRLGRGTAQGFLSYYDAGWAVDTAIAWGADVINMSFGTQTLARAGVPGSYLGEALQRSVNAGVINVAAAGNYNSWTNPNIWPWMSYTIPAAWNTVIGVGAATADGTRWVSTAQQGSNWGPLVSIWASVEPTAALSTLPPNNTYWDFLRVAPNRSKPCYTQAPLQTICAIQDVSERFGATSAASPIVAGVAALMKQANPNLTHYQVESILRSTARKNLSDAAVNEGGLVNAYEAVRQAQNLR